MEYRGVFVATGTEIFKSPVFEGGTNNIGEFLAIVHCLAWQQKNRISLPIYSDSLNGQKWVSEGLCRTKLVENEKNRDDVVKTIAKYIGKEEAYVSNYLYGGITKWSVDPNKKGIVTYTAALKNAGVLKNEISDIASYVDTSIYEQAITTLKDKNKDVQFYADKYQLYQDYNK